MSDSRLFAEMIKGYGINYVFFVPAIASRALVEMDKLGIKRVLAHSELSAAYMADGYARASRGLGVVMAQKVGATNLAAGLRDAYLSASPVLAVTGGTDPDSRYRHQYQHLEDFGIFEVVTKHNAVVEKAERLPDLLRQAFRTAMTGTPGPVHLALTAGAVDLDRDRGELELVVEDYYARGPVHRLEPDQRAVDEALKVLAAAERPVIVAGRGAATSGAGEELRVLAEIMSIPVAYSLNGKALLPDNHHLTLGPVGLYSRWCANKVVSEADLVFFIGSRAGSMVTQGWQVPRPGTALIQLDHDPAEIGRNYPVQVGLLGDAKRTLKRLVDKAGDKVDRQAWVDRAQGYVSQWRQEMQPLLDSEASPIRPERLCKELGRIIPADAALVACTSHAAIWTATLVDLNQPGQDYYRCAGTLGWGFPGAMGVKCALPDRPVISFTGDGGLYYHLSELETAARAGINLIVVVNNNSILGQATTRMKKAYGSVQDDRAMETVGFKPVNFAAIAEEMGCAGIRVQRPAELGAALARALDESAERPVLVDVVTDRQAMPAMPG